MTDKGLTDCLVYFIILQTSFYYDSLNLMEGGEQRPPEDPRVAAVKQFVDKYFQTPGEERKHYQIGEFDVSRPVSQDMERIHAGNYEIRNFSTAPRSQEDGDKKTYHFYVGNTEFHLMGEAADDFEKFQEELLKEPQS